jgi:hypothetical protein
MQNKEVINVVEYSMKIRNEKQPTKFVAMNVGFQS